MIAAGWVWLAYVASCVSFSALAMLFADGWTRGKLKFDGTTCPPIGGVSAAIAIATGLAVLLGPGILDYPHHVPTSDIYTVGGLGGLATVIGVPAAITALVYAVKGLSKFGQGVKWIAGGLRNVFDGVRGVTADSAEVKAQLVEQAKPVAVIGIDEARRKFAAVEGLCSSLRALLKEGPAFEQLGEISAEFNRVKTIIEEDASKRSVLGTLVSDYLVPTEHALGLYERLLKRNVGSANEMLKEMGEKTLPLMREKIVALYDQLHVTDIAQLATVASAFQMIKPVELKLEAEAEAKL